MKKTTPEKKYYDSLKGRGLKRSMQIIPDTPEATKRLAASAKRERKKAGLLLPRD